jgi:cell wall-associated NlpC family hydrolase
MGDNNTTGVGVAVGLVACLGVFMAIFPFLILGAGAGAVPPPSEQCGGAGTGATVAGVALDAEQVGNAQTIVSVTADRKLPVFAAVVAVDTAYTESALHNTTRQTDHDSEGLFQQRVSLYTAAVADDPVNATNAFLDRLIRIPNWQTNPIGTDAQTVQRSARPERYQPNAELAEQLTGQLWPTAAVAADAAGGDIAGGPSTRVFFTQLLRAMRLPVSAGNLDALYEVAQYAGHNDRYNPLSSVIREPGSTGFNSASVQSYRSFESGVAGTVALLQGAPWSQVRAALAGDEGTTAVLAAFRAAYTWDQRVRFPTTNLVAVAVRSVGPIDSGAPICAGGGGAADGGTPVGDIFGPTGNNIAGTTTVPAGFTLSGSAKGNTAARYALAQLGKSYVFGASGPNAFDCSGLTMVAWAAAGVALPHLAAGQVSVGKPEPTNLTQAVSGDLVMIPGSDGTAADPGHVGMVAGYVEKSEGRHLYLVQAPETGVPVELTEATEWSGQIVDVRHIA